MSIANSTFQNIVSINITRDADNATLNVTDANTGECYAFFSNVQDLEGWLASNSVKMYDALDYDVVLPQEKLQ